VISKPRRPEEAVLFVGALFETPDIFEHSSALLREKFGEIFFESPVCKWNYTDYYLTEFDSQIFRKFSFFEPLIDTASLGEIKTVVMGIEKEFIKDGKRRINLDPGYLTFAKVVLASRKNYSHRICVGKAVFAEVELFYRDGRFQPLFYTYSDYRDDQYRMMFEEARGRFKRRMAKNTKTGISF